MVKLFKISATDVVQSLLPILSWYVLASVCGNPEYVNGFMYSYSFQFIFLSVYLGIVKGTLQYSKLHKDKDNNLHSAIIVAFIIMISIAGVCIVYKNSFMNFMQLTDDLFYITIFSILCIAYDYVIIGISLSKQYEEDFYNAFKITVSYYVFRIVSIVLAGYISNNVNHILFYSSVLMFVYILFVFLNEAKGVHCSLDVFKGLKYQMSAIATTALKFILFFFGISDMTHNSDDLVLAYSIMVLCTDTQWDVLRSAINTRTSIAVCDNKFDDEYTVLIKNCVLYSVVLFASSVGMILANRLFTTFNIVDVFIMLLLECSLFPLCAIKYCKLSYLQLKQPCLALIALDTIAVLIRVFVLIKFDHKYIMSIGLFCAQVVSFVCVQLFYKYKQKLWVHQVGSVDV